MLWLTFGIRHIVNIRFHLGEQCDQIGRYISTLAIIFGKRAQKLVRFWAVFEMAKITFYHFCHCGILLCLNNLVRLYVIHHWDKLQFSERSKFHRYLYWPNSTPLKWIDWTVSCYQKLCMYLALPCIYLALPRIYLALPRIPHLIKPTHMKSIHFWST